MIASKTQSVGIRKGPCTGRRNEARIWSTRALVADEIFWSDDRIDDAVSWHDHGRVGGSANIYASGMPALPSPFA
jgi:hypothetical protein